MRKLRIAVIVSVALGALAGVGLATGHLALTDIYHGEGDLTLEWRVLQVCFGIMAVFLVSAMATLVRLAWIQADRPPR